MGYEDVRNADVRCEDVLSQLLSWKEKPMLRRFREKCMYNHVYNIHSNILQHIDFTELCAAGTPSGLPPNSDGLPPPATQLMEMAGVTRFSRFSI